MSKTIVLHHTTETLLPENMERHCRNWPAGKPDSKIIKPQDLTISLMAQVFKDQSGWGFTVKQRATTIHEDSAAYMVSNSNFTMEVETVTHALRWIASRGAVRPRTHQPHTATDSISLLQVVRGGPGSPNWHKSMFDSHLRKLLWIQCDGHAGVKINDRAGRLMWLASRS